MTGTAFGRQIQCSYQSSSVLGYTLWPNNTSCRTPDNTDFSARFESEKHSFSLTDPYGYESSVSKSAINTFYISQSTQLDFIPLDILTEFPNLNGLYITNANLPTVKSGLFKPELQRIEYLLLSGNIKSIEPEAFQYLNKLKWIHLGYNKIQTLFYKLFKNNPDLIYIYLGYNKINSIHPSFFDGLNKLKLVYFTGNVGCFNTKIGCETCLITQWELRGKLQGCFDNCSNSATCLTSYLAHIASQTTENEEVTEIKKNRLEELFQNLTQILEQVSQDNKMAIEGVEVRFLNITNELKNYNQNMPKVIEKAIEANNPNMMECCTSNQKAVEKLQEAMENQLKELKEDLATKVENQLKDFLKQELSSIIQEKLDALQDRLENGA
jgi:hypothetical protein